MNTQPGGRQPFLNIGDRNSLEGTQARQKAARHQRFSARFTPKQNKELSPSKYPLPKSPPSSPTPGQAESPTSVPMQIPAAELHRTSSTQSTSSQDSISSRVSMLPSSPFTASPMRDNRENISPGSLVAASTNPQTILLVEIKLILSNFFKCANEDKLDSLSPLCKLCDKHGDKLSFASIRQAIAEFAHPASEALSDMAANLLRNNFNFSSDYKLHFTILCVLCEKSATLSDDHFFAAALRGDARTTQLHLKNNHNPALLATTGYRPVHAAIISCNCDTFLLILNSMKKTISPENLFIFFNQSKDIADILLKSSRQILQVLVKQHLLTKENYEQIIIMKQFQELNSSNSSEDEVKRSSEDEVKMQDEEQRKPHTSSLPTFSDFETFGLSIFQQEIQLIVTIDTDVKAGIFSYMDSRQGKSVQRGDIEISSGHPPHSVSGKGNGVTERVFQITNTKSQESRTVRHFHVTITDKYSDATPAALADAVFAVHNLYANKEKKSKGLLVLSPNQQYSQIFLAVTRGYESFLAENSSESIPRETLTVAPIIKELRHLYPKAINTYLDYLLVHSALHYLIDSKVLLDKSVKALGDMYSGPQMLNSQKQNHVEPFVPGLLSLALQHAKNLQRIVKYCAQASDAKFYPELSKQLILFCLRTDVNICKNQLAKWASSLRVLHAVPPTVGWKDELNPDCASALNWIVTEMGRSPKLMEYLLKRLDPKDAERISFRIITYILRSPQLKAEDFMDGKFNGLSLLSQYIRNLSAHAMFAIALNKQMDNEQHEQLLAYISLVKDALIFKNTSGFTAFQIAVLTDNINFLSIVAKEERDETFMAVNFEGFSSLLIARETEKGNGSLDLTKIAPGLKFLMNMMPPEASKARRASSPNSQESDDGELDDEVAKFNPKSKHYWPKIEDSSR